MFNNFNNGNSKETNRKILFIRLPNTGKTNILRSKEKIKRSRGVKYTTRCIAQYYKID